MPVAEVKVLNPSRTFWEKATLIHVECHRGRLKSATARLSRHWYDLAKLSQSWVGESAVSDRKLLEDVIVHKKAFFNASYANYDLCLDGKFKLVPNDEEIENLKMDYIEMQNAGMFSQKPQPFNELISVLARLELQINSHD